MSVSLSHDNACQKMCASVVIIICAYPGSVQLLPTSQACPAVVVRSYVFLMCLTQPGKQHETKAGKDRAVTWRSTKREAEKHPGGDTR